MIQINKVEAKRLATIIVPIVALLIVTVIIISNLSSSIDTSLEIPEHEDDGQLIPFGDVQQLSVFGDEATDTILGHIENSIVSMSDAYKTSENYEFIIANISHDTFKQLSYGYPKVCSFTLALDNGVEYNIWARIEDHDESSVTTLTKDPNGIFYVNSTAQDANTLGTIKKWLQETINEVPEIHYMDYAFDVNSVPGFDDTDEGDDSSSVYDGGEED